MHFIDDSPVHPHAKIHDTVHWVKGSNEDEEVTWPRVSISMAAKAVEDEADSFTYVAQSIPCGEETRHVHCGPELHYPVEIKLSRFVRSHLGLFNGPRVIPPDSYVVVYHGKVSIATGADEEDAGFRTVEYTWQGKEYVVDSFDFASEAIYINHTCNPNMKGALYGAEQTDCQPAVVFKAKRTIMPGEELTISYYPEDMCPPEGSLILTPCTCLSEDCTGAVYWVPGEQMKM